MSEFTHILCTGCSRTNRVPSKRLSQRPKCGNCGQLLFQGHPVALNNTTFDRFLRKNSVPVVVDFWAAWCGPCKMMGPVFEEAAMRLEPHVRLAKLNTETDQGIAARFNIRSIPTILIFKEGHEISRHTGAADLQTLVNWIRASV